MSVALRTITRLQDADDINVTLGVGVDEYALCWDNDTSRFVLRAMSSGGVTDHGALTGLADDDHSQYLLATGTRTGASSQAQTFTNGIIGPSWRPASDSATALQMQDVAGTTIVAVDTTNKRLSLPFGTVYSGSTQIARIDVAKGNVFLGASGNASISGGANTGIGDGALATLTSGANNFAAGYGALYGNSTGSNNFALGLMSSYSSNGDGNVGVGNYTLGKTTAGFNVGVGHGAGYGNGGLYAGQNNVFIGNQSGWNAAGSYNVFIGNVSGYYETGSDKLFIDNQDRTDLATSRVSSLVYGEFNGSVANQLLRVNGVLQPLMTDTATNAATTQVKISHNTSGTVANGFGSRVLWELESSTTADQTAAALYVSWNDATHATRKADLILTAYDSGGEREGLRIRGNGSAAAIGFLGAAPAARIAHVADPSGGATVDAEARSAINLILATLETFGLHATS